MCFCGKGSGCVVFRFTDLYPRSSAWFFGGDNITFQGHGYGTLNGGGSAWYSYINGVSNYPGRPMAITIWETTNSVFEGIRFVQSQFWYGSRPFSAEPLSNKYRTMAIIHSDNVVLQDIYGACALLSFWQIIWRSRKSPNFGELLPAVASPIISKRTSINPQS